MRPGQVLSLTTLDELYWNSHAVELRLGRPIYFMSKSWLQYKAQLFATPHFWQCIMNYCCIKYGTLSFCSKEMAENQYHDTSRHSSGKS